MNGYVKFKWRIPSLIDLSQIAFHMFNNITMRHELTPMVLLHESGYNLGILIVCLYYNYLILLYVLKEDHAYSKLVDDQYPNLDAPGLEQLLHPCHMLDMLLCLLSFLILKVGRPAVSNL